MCAKVRRARPTSRRLPEPSLHEPEPVHHSLPADAKPAGSADGQGRQPPGGDVAWRPHSPNCLWRCSRPWPRWAPAPSSRSRDGLLRRDVHRRPGEEDRPHDARPARRGARGLRRLVLPPGLAAARRPACTPASAPRRCRARSSWARLFVVPALVYVIAGAGRQALRRCAQGPRGRAWPWPHAVFACFTGMAYMMETIACVELAARAWCSCTGFALLGGMPLGTLVLGLAGALPDALKGSFKTAAHRGGLQPAQVLAIGGFCVQVHGAWAAWRMHLRVRRRPRGQRHHATLRWPYAQPRAARAALAPWLALLGKSPVAIGAASARVMAVIGIFVARLVFCAVRLSVGLQRQVRHRCCVAGRQKRSPSLPAVRGSLSRRGLLDPGAYRPTSRESPNARRGRPLRRCPTRRRPARRPGTPRRPTGVQGGYAHPPCGPAGSGRCRRAPPKRPR